MNTKGKDQQAVVRDKTSFQWRKTHRIPENKEEEERNIVGSTSECHDVVCFLVEAVESTSYSEFERRIQIVFQIPKRLYSTMP